MHADVHNCLCSILFGLSSSCVALSHPYSLNCLNVAALATFIFLSVTRFFFFFTLLDGFGDLPRSDSGHSTASCWSLPTIWLWGGILDRFVADNIGLHTRDYICNLRFSWIALVLADELKFSFFIFWFLNLFVLLLYLSVLLFWCK
ncbi:hypothetical protein OWV82_008609 [Melia azedarach]|uniref:Uncharacterized protein n=1 Tax=Melia azedarach TaxID=155640 RepID=A0ACC1YAT9_MELAZ|nr:hypothetical protein OWV82_008609 [Melia azedarach]